MLVYFLWSMVPIGLAWAYMAYREYRQIMTMMKRNHSSHQDENDSSRHGPGSGGSTSRTLTLPISNNDDGHCNSAHPDPPGPRSGPRQGASPISPTQQQHAQPQHLHRPNPQPSSDPRILLLQGPGEPQEITFFVTTPPSRTIPVLRTGTKYKSIHRQLAFNLVHMTWEIRKPKSYHLAKEDVNRGAPGNATIAGTVGSATATSVSMGTTLASRSWSSGGGARPRSPATSIPIPTPRSISSNASIMTTTTVDSTTTTSLNHNTTLQWEKASKSKTFSIDSILNISAFVPQKCATVEIIYQNQSVDDSMARSMSETLLSNMVTLDNWKTNHHHHDRHHHAHSKHHGNPRVRRRRVMGLGMGGGSSGGDGSGGGERRKFMTGDNHRGSSFLSSMEDDESSFHPSSEEASVTSASIMGMIASGSGVPGSTVDHFVSSQKGGGSSQKNRGRSSSSPNKARVKEQTTEFTFETELDAGAFQTLFLALRVVGKEIINLYSALELVHKSSEAYDGDTYDGGDGGVALDDVMRCLGDLPFVSKRIARVYEYCIENRPVPTSSSSSKLADHSTSHSYLSSLESFREDGDENHDNANVKTNDDEDAPPSMRKRAHEYQSKRAVLGLVDFFRLFVPKIMRGTPYSTPVAESNVYLSGTDLDGIEAHQARIQQMVVMRQRVAKAAVRVSAYVDAMAIVKEGWKIPVSNIPDYQCARMRLSFDQEDWNLLQDSSTENEYYDPILSRENPTAFALVGCNTFRLSSQMAKADTDPVAYIPNLRAVIEKHPQSEFFVCGLVHKKERLMTIFLFVKWLPKGVDEPFDEAFGSFSRGPAKLRDDSLYFSSAYATKSNNILSFGTNSTEHTARKQIIPEKLFNCIKHFGGSLNTDSQSPNNHLAVLVNVGRLPGQMGRITNKLTPLKGASPHIIDYIFQLQDVDRSMASVRTAHLNGSCIIPLEDIVKEPPKRSILFANKTSLPDDNNTLDENNVGAEGLQDLDTLRDILSDITVPSRMVPRVSFGANHMPQPKERVHDVQVLQLLDDANDIKRHYIAADRDLKEAAIRITKCAAFRGLTFPIDTRECRVELSSGQFFQKGVDKEGDPVFYFRNFCQGLWRKDLDASILAVLHTLESSFVKLSRLNSNFKCTLVVLMGKPLDSKIDNTMGTSDSMTAPTDEDAENIDNNASAENSSQKITLKRDPNNEFHVHTNFKFVQRLLDVVLQNYPERLKSALVIPSGGWEKILGTHGLRRYINSSRTRSKVTILSEERDLEEFISRTELIDVAGGEAQTP